MIAFFLALALLQQPAAAIRGVVVSDDGSNRPVRHALVTLSGADVRTMITGDDGAFVFSSLEAGRYALSASKPGFAESEYGTRPGRNIGVPIALATGQQLTLPLRIARGGVITGRLTTATGEAVSAVTVTASRIDQSDAKAEHALIEAGDAVSDEEGVYRIFGLPEGSFVVTAWPDASKDDATILAPTSYPSAASAVDASLISVKAGEEHGGADIVLHVSHRAAIRGHVVAIDGRSADNLEVSLTLTNGARMTSVEHSGRAITRTGTDGSFAFPGVLTGSYTVAAAQTRLEVHVDGRDATGVSLQLTPARVATTATPGTLGGAGGTLTTTAGAPTPDFLIVVFSADRALWASTPNMTRVIPPDTNGAWTTLDLPPGDYRVAAITEWSRYDRVTTSLLEQLMAASAPIAVKSGDVTIINLHVGG